jgi:phosphate-selective porin OprO/OprP
MEGHLRQLTQADDAIHRQIAFADLPERMLGVTSAAPVPGGAGHGRRMLGGNPMRTASVWTWCILVVVITGGLGRVLAQTPDTALDELRQELRQAQEVLKGQQAIIEVLQKRLAELEARQSQPASVPSQAPEYLQANGAAKPQPSSFSVSWKEGRTTLRFPSAELVLSNRLQYRWTDTTNSDPEKEENGAFRVRRFKTQITGWAYTKDLTFRLQVDWANANTSLGVLDDAWVQYDLTGGKKWFMVRAGQGKTPFGRQSIASTASDMFADRSFVSTQFCSIRDVGVTATGQFGPSAVKDLVEYSVGLFNGEGRSKYDNADGHYQTDVRLVISPWGSAGYDEANPEGASTPKLSLGFDCEHNDHRLKDPKSHDYTSGTYYRTYGYDLLFKYRWFTAYGEYFDRRTTDIKDESTVATGFNAQLGLLLIPRRLEVFVGRWSYDPSRDKLFDRQKETGIGANWYFNGFASKLQADYRRIESDATEYRSYEFRLQYQIVF